MSIGTKSDIGAKLNARLALVGQNIVAGGGADGVEQGPSAVIDRYTLPTPAGVGTSLGPGGGGRGGDVGPGGEAVGGVKDHTLALVLDFDANLADTVTLDLTMRVQHSVDAAFTVPLDLEQRASRPQFIGVDPLVQFVGGAGGTNEVGALIGRYDMAGAARFIRAFYTATFSSGAVDEADVNFSFVFGGADENPFADTALL